MILFALDKPHSVKIHKKTIKLNGLEYSSKYIYWKMKTRVSGSFLRVFEIGQWNSLALSSAPWLFFQMVFSDDINMNISWAKRTNVWYHFVARSSSQQHGAKENVCTPRTETNVGPPYYQPRCENPTKRGVWHHLTPEIVARTIRHHLVAEFYCSANIIDNICPGTIYENDTNYLYVWRIPGTIYENDKYTFLLLRVLCFLGHRHCCSFFFFFFLNPPAVG